MLIKVKDGKGKKDRYTLLSKRLLVELRSYYRKYRPQTYLFPSSFGKRKGQTLSYETIRSVYEDAGKKAGIKRGVGIHTLRHHIHDYEAEYPLWPEHRKIVSDLLNCRTAHLGGHIERCDTCGAIRITYHSCRNRHCPKCPAYAPGKMA